MFSVRSLMLLGLIISSLLISGCDGMTDDLLPSGDDNRPAVDAGTVGTQVEQQSPDFQQLQRGYEHHRC